MGQNCLPTSPAFFACAPNSQTKTVRLLFLIIEKAIPHPARFFLSFSRKFRTKGAFVVCLWAEEFILGPLVGFSSKRDFSL
ncbi:MAG TPA: hypothetical protein DEP42_01715 [Ruminococcaceae bacterium]|nr:hypothetical protein [Oscillospiraceae bacterium]